MNGASVKMTAKSGALFKFSKTPMEFLMRKNLLIMALSALTALFIMLVSYLYLLPVKNIQVDIFPSDKKDSRSESNEVRLFYVLADDDIVVLDEYAKNGWQYKGTLFTRQTGVLQFNLPVRRYAEFSLKKGPGCGIVTVVSNGESREYNLYHEADNQQEIITVTANRFYSALNIFVGLIVFIILCVLLNMVLLSRLLSEFWNKTITFGDLIISFGIPAAVFFAMVMNVSFPLSRIWTALLDISGFISQARLFNMGLVPYKEIWDHKGPMIFFFTALGSKLWYPYGTWFFESLLQIAGFFFCFRLLRFRFSRLIAFFATIMAIGTYAILQANGGMTESWSLPFIFAAEYIFICAFRNKCSVSNRLIVLCGALGAVVILFRMNNAILWLAAVPILAFNQIKNKNIIGLLKQVGWFCLGLGIIVLPTCLYFLINGALYEMIEATVLFNIIYSKSNNTGLYAQIYGTVGLFDYLKNSFPGFLQIMLAGFIYPIIRLRTSLQQSKKDNANNESLRFDINFFALQLLYFIFFLLFGAISARSYPHYLITAVPAFAAAFAYALEFLYEFLIYLLCDSKRKTGLASLASILVVSVALLSVKPLYALTLSALLSDRKTYSMAQIDSIAAANYIMANTPENSKYGYWGGDLDMTVNAMIRNRAPASRFYHTFIFRYTFGLNLLKIYIGEIKENMPRFFVIQRFENLKTDEADAFIDEYYSPVDIFSEHSYIKLYERKE